MSQRIAPIRNSVPNADLNRPDNTREAKAPKAANDDQHLQQRVEHVFVDKGQGQDNNQSHSRDIDPRDQAEQNNVVQARADRAGREEQRGFVIHTAYDEHARRDVAARVIGRRPPDFARTTGPTVDEQRAQPRCNNETRHEACRHCGVQP